MNRCDRVDPHRCTLARHLLPDLTADPEGQSGTARLLGVLFLLCLFGLAGMVGVR